MNGEQQAKIVERCLKGEAVTIRIRWGIKGGRTFFLVDDGNKSALYAISRVLTGTTGEEGNGIFCESSRVEFIYGMLHKIFEFPPLDIANPQADIKALLIDRITAVREWVASIDFEREVEFKI